MSNTGKIISSILGFIICAMIGFGGTKWIVGALNRPEGPAVADYQGASSPRSGQLPSPAGGNALTPAQEPKQQPAQSAASSAQPAQASPSVQPSQPVQSGQKTPSAGSIASEAPSEVPVKNPISSMLATSEILAVSTPVYHEKEKVYTFSVTAKGGGLTYVLADSKQKDIRSQQNGEFRVSGTSVGKYYVYVKDAQGNKSPMVAVDGCRAKVKPVEASELQGILNSGDSSQAVAADFKNRISSNCRYVFLGRDEDEGDAPRSYNEIINRIKMRTWSSVQVQSVSYNESGKVAKATILVKY